MDAEGSLGLPGDLLYDGPDRCGEVTAVRVTEHKAVRSRFLGSEEALQGELRVGFVTIKKVFGIEKDCFRILLEIGDGVVNDLEILLKGDLQGLPDMEIPGLSENGDDPRLGIKQGLDIRVILDPVPRTVGRPEGHNEGVREGELLRLLEVLRVPG